MTVEGVMAHFSAIAPRITVTPPLNTCPHRSRVFRRSNNGGCSGSAYGALDTRSVDLRAKQNAPLPARACTHKKRTGSQRPIYGGPARTDRNPNSRRS